MRPSAPPEGDRRAPADLRLLPAAAAAWGSAAWAVAARPGIAATAAAVALVLTAALARAAGRPRRPGLGAAAVALACAATVLVSTAAQVAVRGTGPLPDLVADRATVEAVGVVASDPHPVRPDPQAPWAREDRLVVVVHAREVRGRGRTGSARAPLLVLGGSAWAAARPGSLVAVTGRLAPVEPGDDVVALLVARGGPQVRAEPPGWQRRAEALRAGLRRACEPLSADAGGLLPGLVVGDTSRLPTDLEEDMRAVGLTHLTAVSGANVAIVCGTVLVVAAACGARRGPRLALAVLALAGFVVLARPEPSVLRAAVMGAIGLLGLAAGRRGRGVPLLATAVVVLTAVDPWLARSPGFALSVLATGALLLLARPMAAALARVLPRLLAEAVAVPAAAQAVCAPVVVLLAPSVPLLAVPANLLVAPAVAPATVLGIVATALAPAWLPAAEVVARLAGLATGWIAVVARVGADVPAAAVPWPSGAGGAVLLAALTVLGLLAGAALLRRLARRRARAPAGRRHRAARPRPCGSVLTAAVVAVALACAAAVATAVAVRVVHGAGWPPAGWRMVACDVGQGDATVVATGPGQAVVVDAGPEAAPVAACLDRLGVTRVPLLVLSHFHADHVAGLEGVLRGRRVERAVVSPLAVPAGQAADARAELAAAGVPAQPGAAGLTGRVGDVMWRVLWPSGAGVASDDESSAANNASVVLLLQAPGLRLLLPGDIEPPAQQALRAALETGRLGDVAPVDVLKVAHHGSAAQDRALHRLLAPRVATVSAGRGNDYGHPTAAALALLRDAGAVVARTDTGGDVAVGGTGERLWVATARTGGAEASGPRGRLGAWQQDAARPPQRAGRTSSRRRWSSSRAPSRSWRTARSSGCAGGAGRPAPTWSWPPWRRPPTRAGSSRRGRAPPCSASPGWWWPRTSSSAATRSSPTCSATWPTCSRTWCSCCATAVGSGARSCSTRSGGPPPRWWWTARC